VQGLQKQGIQAKTKIKENNERILLIQMWNRLGGEVKQFVEPDHLLKFVFAVEGLPEAAM
jgi:hypothetical protein